MNKRLLCIGLLLALVSVLVGCEQEPSIESSGKILKIGVIAPFSGSDFAKGKEGLKGVQTVIKMQPLLNNGDRIEIVTKDDQDDPTKSVQALKELVGTDQVSAVVTFSSSGPALAMAKAADIYQIPILAALATHPDVTKTSGYISQVCFDDVLQGKVAALYVRDELLVDKVAVFHSPQSNYSSNLATEFTRRFTLLGGEITDQIHLNGKNTGISKRLTNIRKKNPELLYLPIAAKDVIIIIQEIDQMGWRPKLMASDGLLATIFSQYKDQLGLVDGILATDFFHNASRGTPFSDRVGEAHEGSGTSYTALGVEGFAILLDAMNRCEDAEDRECINRQIRSTTDFEGLLGKISIDLEGKAHRPVVINSIKKNKLKYIVKVY